tara:strand:- start:1734 stop:2258 length:525 start_codon:yes stop_codon:yes gene_type:complete
MKKIKTKIKGLFILQGKKFTDQRGWLKETFKENHFKKKMVFSITSKSKKNVLRGLHLQTKKSQDKLITCLKGKILDVAVDLRKNSQTFGKYHKVIISEKNSKSFFIPKGFAHGFLGLDKENIVTYSCSNYRDKNSEVSIRWNDKKLKIKWGISKPVLSKKDKKAIFVSEYLKKR